MGQAFGKLIDGFSGNSNEIQVVMMGLDAAGKTSILQKLQTGEVLPTVPTVGFSAEEVQYKNVTFAIWDVGGQGRSKLRPLWKHFFHNTDGLIYVVDSLDRERIGEAKAEFQDIIKDPYLLNKVILVFANKQDMLLMDYCLERGTTSLVFVVKEGAMTPMEVCEELGLLELVNRKWHLKGTSTLRGDGLSEGLDWLISTLKVTKATEYSSVGNSSS